MKNDKLHTILLLIAIIMMAISFVCVYNKTSSNTPKADTVTKVDTFWKDSIIYKDKIKLVPKKIVETKHDTITGDTVLTTEQKYYQETFYMGKDTATVGILTTGINTTVDSVSIMLKTRKPTVVQTVEITKYVEKKRKWFHIQPQATFGYDPLNKNWGAVIGLGIGVDF